MTMQYVTRHTSRRNSEWEEKEHPPYNPDLLSYHVYVFDPGLPKMIQKTEPRIFSRTACQTSQSVPIVTNLIHINPGGTGGAVTIVKMGYNGMRKYLLTKFDFLKNVCPLFYFYFFLIISVIIYIIYVF